MLIRAVLAALISVAAPALAEPENTHWPNYQEGDFIIPNYKFVSGETLPQLKLHYRTLGSAERNGAGILRTQSSNSAISRLYQSDPSQCSRASSAKRCCRGPDPVPTCCWA